MFSIDLRGPGDQSYHLDTPDPALIGIWLKTIFDLTQRPRPGTAPIPITFTITIAVSAVFR